MALKPALGAHRFQITVRLVSNKELWVRKKIGRAGKIVILSTLTSTEIPHQKTSKKKPT